MSLIFYVYFTDLFPSKKKNIVIFRPLSVNNHYQDTEFEQSRKDIKRTYKEVQIVKGSTN